MSHPNRVAVVVAAGYVDRLRRLAEEAAVWVVDLPEYAEAVADIRRHFTDQYPSRGATTFTADDRTLEENALDILPTLEEHHGPASTGRLLDAIDVIGVAPTPAMRAEVAAIGLPTIVEHPDGFTARPA